MAYGGGRGMVDVVRLATWNVMAECGGLIQVRYRVCVCVCVVGDRS